MRDSPGNQKRLMYNSKSLLNLNPGKEIIWNDQDFKSLSELSRFLEIPYATLHDRFRRDELVDGHYIDYL